MKLTIKVLLHLVCLLFSNYVLRADTLLTDNQEYENSKIQKNKVDENVWKKAKDGLEYNEKKEKKEFDLKLPEKPAPLVSSQALKIILSVIIILIIAYILYRIFSDKMLFKKKLKVQQAFDVEDINEEKIEEFDLNPLLNDALANKNYRIAIRIYFLMVIKALKMKELIVWTKDKTNRDYKNELAKTHLYSGFSILLPVYEKIWYGDTFIDEIYFEESEPKFKNYLTDISLYQPVLESDTKVETVTTDTVVEIQTEIEISKV